MQMKKRKKLVVIGIVVLVIIAILGVFFFIMFQKQAKELEALSYQDVDMSTVEDGSYIGNVETIMIKATVEVTVLDHSITDIKIINHDNGKGKPAETIVTDMIEQNRCDVDAISGATASSKVIKSAVRDALIKGIKE
jgi:uncharacterized protein with FMN-binding domain